MWKNYLWIVAIPLGLVVGMLISNTGEDKPAQPEPTAAEAPSIKPPEPRPVEPVEKVEAVETPPVETPPVEKGPKSDEFNLANYRGKYVLLDFWATWCGPCREEMPNVKAVYEAYKNDSRLIIVGVDLDANPEDAKKYIENNGLGWTHVFLGEWSKTPIPDQYGVKGIPHLVLFDPEGKILARDLRGAEIGEAVRKALGGLSQPEPEPAVPSHTLARPQPVVVSSRKTITPSNQGTIDINIDRDMEYVPEGFPMGMSAFQTEAPPLDDDPLETLSAEPKYRSPEEVRYGCVVLGNSEDNRFTFVLDDLKAKTWIAYFDRNNNEDLTDDGPPITNQGTGWFAANIDADVPIVLASGTTLQRPYRFWMWCSTETATFYAVCHYRADMNINGSNIVVLAFERKHHDALYADAGIWLDANADGRIDEDRECFTAGSSVTIKGQSLKINLDFP